MNGACTVLRQHWPEYLIEAAGLGVFMVVAGICVMLLEQPGAPLHQAIATSPASATNSPWRPGKVATAEIGGSVKRSPSSALNSNVPAIPPANWART